MNADARRSKIALGLGVVQLLFIGETWVANHHLPNPASPYVWTALGVGALLMGAAWAAALAFQGGIGSVLVMPTLGMAMSARMAMTATTTSMEMAAGTG